MSNQHDQTHRPEPLDEFVSALLDCGGVLSQMISGMVRFEAAGASAPDLAPIPEVAHEIVASVLDDLRRTYSKRDIQTAAAMIALTTEAICNNIFAVDPSLIEAARATENEPDDELGGEPGWWCQGPASLN